jgi:hypothetical protein
VLAALGTDVGAVDAVLVNAAAAFANNVTPFGQAGGEPATALLVAEVGGTPFERALGAITSFDVLNVVPSLSLAAVGVAAYATVTALGVRLRTVAAGLAVVAVVAGSRGAADGASRRHSSASSPAWREPLAAACPASARRTGRRPRRTARRRS